MVLTLEHTSETRGGLVSNTDFWVLTQSYRFMKSEVASRIGISVKFPSDTEAASAESTI